MDIVNLKIKNLGIAEKFAQVGLLKEANLLRSCTTFVAYKNLADGNQVLHRSNFCKSKFCPICNEIKKNKHKIYMKNILNGLDIENNDSYHLILTLKNCDIDNVKNTIDKFKSAWVKIVRTVEVKIKMITYIYYVHVEYNKENSTYNIHTHVIVIYNDSTKDLFVDEEKGKWSKALKKAAKINYDPVVEMRKIADKKEIVKVAGYCAKGIDVADVPIDELKQLTEQLDRVRLLQPAQKLNKLFNKQKENLRKRKYIQLTSYVSVKKWNNGKYQIDYEYDPETYNRIKIVE